MSSIQSKIWSSSIPLHITHSSSTIPYIIQAPRLSYLALLLPRLTFFFGPATSFSYESIILRNLPIGLLYDLYQPELPWRLTLGDGPLFDIHDTFINSVKEVCHVFCPTVSMSWFKRQADFLRNGTAKGIMSLSKEHSTQLWNAVQDSSCYLPTQILTIRLTIKDDLTSFNTINLKLLNPPSPLRHIPLRVYIPSGPSTDDSVGSFRVVQSLVQPMTPKRMCTTHISLVFFAENYCRRNSNPWISFKYDPADSISKSPRCYTRRAHITRCTCTILSPNWRSYAGGCICRRMVTPMCLDAQLKCPIKSAGCWCRGGPNTQSRAKSFENENG